MTGTKGSSSARRRQPRAAQASLYRVPPKRRFRSDLVVLGSFGAVILACCGYGIVRDSTDRTCVDPKTQQVIDAYHCRSGGHGSWYYGGHSGGIGSKATGGSFERGGFGSRFSGGGG